MIVNGIIAEYNPFHNGHQFHLEEAKKSTGADYTVVVMSGNFTQRGEPAIAHKYIRTKMALVGGADLVLELPSLYAVGSAQYFANGSVSLLDRLGVVDYLCFGSESGEIGLLKQLASLLIEEPLAYQEVLRQELKRGMSYPLARSRALCHLYPKCQEMLSAFSAPNTILGIEYLQCLLRRNSTIQPMTISRKGSHYHDTRPRITLSSALAIRHILLGQEEKEVLRTNLPPSVFSILQDYWGVYLPMEGNDFSLLLHYKLLNEAKEGFSRYMDVTPALSDKIVNNLYAFNGFDSFCDLLKSKDMTYTRISRSLIHILLGIERQHYEYATELHTVPYAKVLGFRKDARPLLARIKEKSEIPLLTKTANASKLLSASALEMFQRDIVVSDIYMSVLAAKSKQSMLNEYMTSPVIF
ncbi:MAG: nucleotidyltransferase [Lachnospiraceae bacterium]|nr:nucleotidyltransferase [Lachnospiraceae bacterium]